ncbi:PAS domain S-box protein [Paraburkholderia humisilvae]|uniref:histidine kinase n=1 Tax=Paraburkholderia humisilvae TaxID=627669 RepID=A0A6J5E9X0_9BURK|nr:PAS domain S-box protein [Paraburkholderia humisilvae]CAB3762414.1 Sensor histidine kinase RcsC [Paraburkholderia humisilvae]
MATRDRKTAFVAGDKHCAPADPASSTDGPLKGLVEANDHCALAILDRDGCVISWNIAAERLTGHVRADVSGRHLSFLYAGAATDGGLAADALAQRDLNSAAYQGRIDGERRLRRIGNTPIRAGVAISAATDPTGELAGFNCMFTACEDASVIDDAQLIDASSERFAQIVQDIQDYAIFMLDRGGHVMSWNAGAQHIKGYRPDEIIGRHFSTFYSAEDKAAGKPERELVLAEQFGRVEDEGWRIRKDGTKFWANVVITALRGADGRLRGFAKVTRDLTTRRAQEETLRQSEERFRLMVESVKDYAIFMLDADGNVATWNSGATQIKGYQRDEIIGRPISVFYSADDNAALKPQRELEIAARFGRVEDEGWRVRKDGSMFWANVVITAVRDSTGRLLGFAKVTRDMSERKRLEELEVSSRRMSEFLATLAHELRNPLAPVRNAVSAMQLAPDTDPLLRQCRDVIDRQVGHLTRLVDDLLDIGRITTGKIDLRIAPVDIQDVVTRSIEAARPFTDARGQTIRVVMPATPLAVRGDLTRLVQVLQNLLNNASKFSPNGTQISIHVATERRSVVVRVKDQGRGIPESALDSIFDLFMQEGHAQNPTDTGLGIGLTLCRSLVELHGGAILASSAGRGRGSTFTVRLPLAPGAGHDHDDTPSSIATTPYSAALRVLVVDDNRDSADSLAVLLEMKGHEARVAYDGQSAVAAAKSYVPHLVLTDLAMPNVDGFGLLRELRSNPKLSLTRVVAMSGFGQASDREQSLAAGFDAHLVKPLEIDVLNELLDSVSRPTSNH